jgi:hypothetical protein
MRVKIKVYLLNSADCIIVILRQRYTNISLEICAPLIKRHEIFFLPHNTLFISLLPLFTTRTPSYHTFIYCWQCERKRERERRKNCIY